MSKNYPIMQILGHEKIDKYSNQLVKKEDLQLYPGMAYGSRKPKTAARKRVRTTAKQGQMSSKESKYQNVGDHRSSNLETAQPSFGRAKSSGGLTGPTRANSRTTKSRGGTQMTHIGSTAVSFGHTGGSIGAVRSQGGTTMHRYRSSRRNTTSNTDIYRFGT